MWQILKFQSRAGHENSESQDEGSRPEDVGSTVGSLWAHRACCGLWALGMRHLQALDAGDMEGMQDTPGSALHRPLWLSCCCQPSRSEMWLQRRQWGQGWGSHQGGGAWSQRPRWKVELATVWWSPSPTSAWGIPCTWWSGAWGEFQTPENTELESGCQRPPPDQWDSSVSAWPCPSTGSRCWSPRRL